MEPIKCTFSNKSKKIIVWVLSILLLIFVSCIIIDFLVNARITIITFIPLLAFAIFISLIFDMNKIVIVTDKQIEQYRKTKLIKTHKYSDIKRCTVTKGFGDIYFTIDEKKDVFLIPISTLDKETLHNLKRQLKNHNIDIHDKRNLLDKR